MDLAKHNTNPDPKKTFHNLLIFNNIWLKNIFLQVIHIVLINRLRFIILHPEEI